MRGPFEVVDLIGKKPPDSPGSFGDWYLDLLFRQTEAVRAETHPSRHYIASQIRSNFNQRFLGWDPLDETSPFEALQPRQIRMELAAQGPWTETALMTLMLEEPDILSRFGLTLRDLMDMTVAETDKMRKLLSRSRQTPPTSEGDTTT